MQAETISLRKGARLDVAKTPEEFPLGARGQRPCTFTLRNVDDVQRIKELQIPGVIARGSRFECAWDAARVIAEYVGDLDLVEPAVKERENAAVPLPGKQRYAELGLGKVRRDYQAEGTKYLLRRAYAVLGDFPRAGKCLMIICTAVLADAKHVLICANALGKYVWAEEIAKWTGEATVLLFGRGGDEARVFCVPCRGSGEVRRSDVAADGTSLYSRCKACRGRGERIYHVRELVAEKGGEVWFAETGKTKKDGTPKLQRRVAAYSAWPPVWRCPKHKDEVDSEPRRCQRCQAEMSALLARHRWCVVNYDIVQSHRERTDTGMEIVRADLPGWGPHLARIRYEMAVLDEGHRLRSDELGVAKGKQNRAERVAELVGVDTIPRVYDVTGTFFYGFTRDGWRQLDIISGGLWS